MLLLADFVKAATRDTANVYSYWCKDQIKQLKTKPALHTYAKV